MSQNGTKPRRLHWRNFESFRSKGTYLLDPYTCLRIKNCAARAPMWWRCTRISSKTVIRWHVISTALEHSQGHHGCHWVSGSRLCPTRLISLSLGEQTSLLFSSQVWCWHWTVSRKFKGTIISAYHWLSENYTEGDRIFLFGDYMKCDM